MINEGEDIARYIKRLERFSKRLTVISMMVGLWLITDIVIVTILAGLLNAKGQGLLNQDGRQKYIMLLYFYL